MSETCQTPMLPFACMKHCVQQRPAYTEIEWECGVCGVRMHPTTDAYGWTVFVVYDPPRYD